ncbi:PilW family protein [uncultured Massilia sp.]|uniref:PilW family protein n=1 Tax=uncultured Massilia sp. TaxID=169973 RepID=UPI0025D51A7A|nr:PilW family protein [uncultured Massilia sp.]
MTRAPRPARRARGFSLVELMVSVVVGLLALLFALRLFTGAEAGRQSALGGSDAMQNGMVALFALGGDAEQAGFGLNDPIVAGCNTVFSDTQGYTLAPATRGAATIHPLAPVVIESNGANPDRVSFYAGSSVGGTGMLRVVASYANGTSLTVDRPPLWFDAGTVIVVAPDQAGGTCALAQVSGTNGTTIQFAGGGGRRYNSGALGPSFTANAARVFNLGPADTLALRTWSVSDGYLQLRSTGATGSASAAAVSEGVVSIKAQYGFDTRAGAAFRPEYGMQVGRWSSTMVDADGSGVSGDAADWQRIAAVRLAVVARSKAVENPAAGAACTATTARPVVFAGQVPAGVDAAPVTLDVAVAGDPVNWQCYRYRTFETVVMLRNASWRPQ